MRLPRSIFVACIAIATSPLAAQKITFQEHIKPIFNASCVSCHNPDKAKGGLDVSTYPAMMKGGSSGKIVEPGDADSSLVYQLVTHKEEPFMPLKASKLPDAQLELIRKWIADGALDSGGSPVVVDAKPKTQLKLASVPSAKPQAVAMPVGLSVEPIARTERAGAAGAIAASPWAPVFAVSATHEILLYHSQSLDLLGVLRFAEGLPKVLKFSRSGAILLAGGGVGGQSGRVALYDVVSGRRVAQVGEEYDEVLAADISPDQSTVALGGPGKLVKFFSVADGTLQHKLTQHTDWITAIAYSPDGVLLASGDRNGGLRVWEAGSAGEFYTLNGHKAAITHVCFRADSNVLASASEDGTVKLWDMNNGQQIKSWSAHGSGVMSVDFAPDGRIVTAGRDQLVRVWDGDGKKLVDLPALRDIALHAVFAQAGAEIVAADLTGNVRVSASADGKQSGETNTNPPTIAEQLVDARHKVAQAQAVALKASKDLVAAQDAATKASAALDAAKSDAATKQKTLDKLKIASTQPATTAPAATQASAKISADTGAVQTASAELKAATDAIQKQSDAAKSADAARLKAQQVVSDADAQLASAKADLKKWKLAEVSSQLSVAQDELTSLSNVNDQLGKALAQIESANRALAEGPGRVTAAVAVLRPQQSATAAVAEREAIVLKAGELAKLLVGPSTKPSADAVVVAAAAKVKESVDGLSAGLEPLRQKAAGAVDAVKKSADELSAAEAALAAAKSELAAAPSQLEQARKQISQSVVSQLQTAKERVDRLQAERKQIEVAP